MSQSRFSIVLVGVSALLRRPLVSRLRSADGERSPWVVFAARRCLPFRRLPLGGLVLPLGGWPSGSLLPLFGTHRFGVAARRVGLRAHGFRFSARTASALPLGGLAFELPFPLFGTHRFGVALGELAFGLTTSAFRHAPLRGCHSAGWPSGSRLPLFGTHRSAPTCRRREGRRSAPTRHLFHFKTLIPTC